MRREELLEKLGWFWDEFKRHRIGMLGLAITMLFVVVAILTPFLTNIDPRQWQNPSAWKDNPSSALPVWYNMFTSKKLPEHKIMRNPKITSTFKEGVTTVNLTYRFSFTYDEPPVSLKIDVALNFSVNSGIYIIYLNRPDGESIRIYAHVFKASREAKPPYSTTFEIVVGANEDVRKTLKTWLLQHGYSAEKLVETSMLFSKKGPGMANGATGVLKGDYSLVVQIIYAGKDPKFKVTESKLIVGGKVFGLLGTDKRGRDLWQGILWGVPIALLIGVLSSVISVAIGVLYGVTSGYAGGYVDEAMMRLTDVLMAIPVLPILITLAIIFRPSVWLIIFLISIFGWMGLSKVTRSMALQLKETPFVEAARAIGAGPFRIITRHIAPHVLPYAFASLALGIPGAILTEAGLSFLGLGDPTLPTWGTILHDAEIGGALSNNMWWWWLPPGLLITLLSLGFVFIGHAIDEIVNPKLKKL